MPRAQHLQVEDIDKPENSRMAALLTGLGSSLTNKYDLYAGARYEKEREWERAIHQYEGHWDVDDVEKIQQALSARGSNNDPVSVNITRPKTNVAIARMKDVQFPTGGDFNFYLKPAPLSEAMKNALAQTELPQDMQQGIEQAGLDPTQMPAPAQVAQDIVDVTIARVPKMERMLRNRLIEADYGRKARLAIEDLCIKGSAVIKGPTIQHIKRSRYVEEQAADGSTVQVLEEYYEPSPTTQRVDPLLLFPDPSARQPDEIEDLFELHGMSKRDLIKLAKNPAFIRTQIAKVLDEEPDNSKIPSIIQRVHHDRDGTVTSRYWVKEYHGPLDKQVLYDAGMISEEDRDNNLFRPTGEVWFCNKQVIRISLSHIDGMESLPYGIAVWEKDPNSVFGHGSPYLLRDAQRTVNNAYLMLLDNASLTSGPQIVMNKEMIQPAGGSDYSIRPHKVWFMTEYGADVREAMQFIDIPAQMEGIAQIIDTAMQFADVESSTPLLQQGDMPSGNNTTTGLAMVASASNIIQKAASMNWDDYITKPLMKRYYHYEMQYGPDASVKGDFEIEVGGATERIEAEIRAQEIERMIGLAGSNEEFMMHVDPNKAFRALVDNTRTGDVLRSIDEVNELKAEQAEAAAQQQQADPETMKAQAAMITAESRKREAEAKAQLDTARQEMAVMEVQARYEAQIAEAESRQNEATLNYQLGMARLAAEQEKTQSQLMKDLQLADVDANLQLTLKKMDFAKQEREIEVKNEHGEGI